MRYQQLNGKSVQQSIFERTDCLISQVSFNQVEKHFCVPLANLINLHINTSFILIFLNVKSNSSHSSLFEP